MNGNTKLNNKEKMAKGLNSMLDTLNPETIKFLSKQAQKVARDDLTKLLHKKEDVTIEGKTVQFSKLSKFAEKGMLGLMDASVVASSQGRTTVEYLKSKKDVKSTPVGNLLGLVLLINTLGTDISPFTPMIVGDTSPNKGLSIGYSLNVSESAELYFDADSLGSLRGNISDDSFIYSLEPLTQTTRSVYGAEVNAVRDSIKNSFFVKLIGGLRKYPEMHKFIKTFNSIDYSPDEVKPMFDFLEKEGDILLEVVKTVLQELPISTMVKSVKDYKRLNTLSKSKTDRYVEFIDFENGEVLPKEYVDLYFKNLGFTGSVSEVMARTSLILDTAYQTAIAFGGVPKTSDRYSFALELKTKNDGVEMDNDYMYEASNILVHSPLGMKPLIF